MISVKVGGSSIKIDKFNFPTGEVSVRLAGGEAHLPNTRATKAIIDITFNYEADYEIIELAMIVDAVRRRYNKTDLELHLYMPYVPYSRQDRVCNTGEALSSKVLCDIINSMGFKTVTTLDNHSEVVTALLNNCINISPCNKVKDIVYNLLGRTGDKIALVSPDAGANKKVHAAAMLAGVPMVRCDKTRDLTTGKITGTTVINPTDFDISEYSLLVVDDICDGGYTFNALAEELAKVTKGNLYLYVTHGKFTKGLDELKSNYKCVFTSNTLFAGDTFLKVLI